MTHPIHPQSFARTVPLLLALFACPSSLTSALADEAVAPAPPRVDAPPPPPVPATVDVTILRYVAARPVYATQPAQAQAGYASQTGAQPAYAQPAYGDPYGFTAWLNGVRAQNGRGPVSYDANLSSWAAANNGQQQARGMGHHVMGGARRQNSGMGAAATVWQMWMASPAHQAALLDPTISLIGIAASGSYWTFNAN